jgi:hypothetical protein
MRLEINYNLGLICVQYFELSKQSEPKRERREREKERRMNVALHRF